VKSSVPRLLKGIFRTIPLSTSSVPASSYSMSSSLPAAHAAEEPPETAHEVSRHRHVEFRLAQRRQNEWLVGLALGKQVAHQQQRVVDALHRQLDVVGVLHVHPHDEALREHVGREHLHAEDLELRRLQVAEPGAGGESQQRREGGGGA
jgi:hypothetical protein